MVLIAPILMTMSTAHIYIYRNIFDIIWSKEGKPQLNSSKDYIQHRYVANGSIAFFIAYFYNV